MEERQAEGGMKMDQLFPSNFFRSYIVEACHNNVFARCMYV